MCKPLIRQRVSAKNGSGQMSFTNARLQARLACARIHGPRPEGENIVCRHLCENDSTMPNGFICIQDDHICWDTASNNMYDEYSEKGKRNIARQREILSSICSSGGKANLGKKRGPYKKRTAPISEDGPYRA
jgi:hypothetical protein